MKILLIEPTKAPLAIGGEDVYLYEPLALEYIAAGIVRNHDVRILDLRLENTLQSVLYDFCPDVVGITSYTVHVNTVKKLFEQIKRWNPQILTVVGGHHATVVSDDFLSPFIDLIVIGEGVYVFEEIIKRREKDMSYDDIPGIALAKNNSLVKNNGNGISNLDDFPFPRRDLTAKYRKQYFSEWMKPLASIRTSKGCPHRCNFCVQWKLTGGRYLRRKPENIVEELAELEEKYVFFADDESLVDTNRMKTLAQLIKDTGIQKQYFLYGRSDTIARNPELLEVWRNIGLERIFVGFEFFSDQDLAYIHKGSKTSDNETAVRILHDLDIDIYASFILRPEFTKNDFAQFRQYCHRLDMDYASFAVLTPLPGTEFYEEVKPQLITNNYDYFDFIHTLLPTKLPLKEFYDEYYDLLKNALPRKKQFALLKKFPLKEFPSVLTRSLRIYKRLKTVHLDYEIEKSIHEGSHL